MQEHRSPVLQMERGPTRDGMSGHRWLPWLIVAAGCAVYLNSLSVPFLFDDFDSIVENAQIRRLWPPWDPALALSDMTVAGRPTVMLSLQLNYALGRLDVRGYHALNLMIHLLAALVLFGIVRRTLLSRRLRETYRSQAPWLALAVSLVWVAHPLLTGSVTYIVQRAESLMGLCFLLTLYALLRGDSSPRPERWYAAAVASCGLGMGSKETMVSAPLLALLYDRAFLAASFRDVAHRRHGLYAGLAATWLVLGLSASTGGRVGKVLSWIKRIPPWDYANTQGGVIVHYLRLAVWPNPLVIDYGGWPTAKLADGITPAAIVIAALVVATLWAWRRRPEVGFLGAWFFLILAPTSSALPVPTEIAAEHRMYLPMAAVVALVVLGGWNLLRHTVPREGLRRCLAVGVTVIVVVGLGCLANLRNLDYRSELAMWRDATGKRPNNPRAHNNLGFALAALGQDREAMSHYTTAIQLQPDYDQAHNNLGVVLERLGQFEEAIAHFQEAVRLNPRYVKAHHNLGLALVNLGRLDEAIAQYREALRLHPNNDREVQHDLEAALDRQRQAQTAGTTDLERER